jgi:serine/threonine-protein kinase
MVAPPETPVELASWQFGEGEEIAADLTAITLLGGGDRTEAWLAWDARLHSPVVAKLIRPDQLSDARAREALAREASTLAALQHPSIVRAFRAEVDGPRPLLVLEALDGPRLSTLLRRFGPLASEPVVSLAVNVASALAYLHDAGYLHLDVKPRNLIIGAAPRLIDLGIARRQDEIGLLTSPIGTDAYMAPEQCSTGRLAEIGAWSDVWGFAATLYEASSGRRPFEPTPAIRFPQLTTLARPLEARLPDPLKALIEAGLRPEPKSRPPLTSVLAALDEMYPAAHAIARRRVRRRIR